MSYKRYLVVGDVHGCLDELNELLKLASFKKGQDYLVFAGDLVDRGPDPVGCVRLARTLGAVCVMGNHEEKHIRWRSWETRIRNGEARKNPMRRFDERRMQEHNALTDDDMDYLRAMPKLLRFMEGWLVVHAGFECNGVPPGEQSSSTVCRVRDVDARGKMAADHKNPLNAVAGAVPWATKWAGPESVVYGHAVHDRASPRVDRHDGYACFGIDTGCVFGGTMTALVLPAGSPPNTEPEFVQVPARREYYPWGRDHGTND